MKNSILYFFLFGLALFSSIAYSQKPFSFEKLMKDNPEIRAIMNNPKYQVQIIYTQVNRDKNNFPSFESFAYQVDPKLYFYPASTVKMPAAFLALQRLNELGIDPETSLKIGADRFPQSAVEADTSSQNKLASIAQYIRKIFLVSDNDAFNRLYEYLGQDYLNSQLVQKGFLNSQIKHRLVGGYTGEENQYVNPFWFFNVNKEIIYERPGLKSMYPFPDLGLKKLIRGSGYYDDATEKVIYQPFDFSKKNFISLEDLHNQLQRVIFPDAFSISEQFHLSKEHYGFLYRSMSALPRKTEFPKYELPDNYIKYILYGDETKTFQIPEHIKIFNKPGWAYGFMTDVAYVADEQNGVEFLLAVQLLVNENDIFNDGKYQYEEVGAPFMGKLGKAIYKIEIERKKKNKPNLSIYFNN